ncbi:MAG: hypothetical protein AAFZ58_05215 [Pseudomonadota bacterium]
MNAARASWPFWPLAVVVVILPIVAVTVSATISMALELVPRCMPFVEGCTSISATGRYPPASYVFKGLLLPYTMLLAAYWWFVVAWLARLPDTPRWQTSRTCLGLALFSAFALAVYAVLLGTRGDAYEFMRRFGIYFFFLFTVVAQVMCALRMAQSAETRAAGRWQLRIAIGMLAFGALNLALKAILEDPDRAENVIEWNFALIMFANLAPVIRPLHRAGVRIELATTPPNA